MFDLPHRARANFSVRLAYALTLLPFLLVSPVPAFALDNGGSDELKKCEARHESCMNKCTGAGHAFGDCSKVCAQLYVDCNETVGWSEEVENVPQPPKGGHHRPTTGTAKPPKDLFQTPMTMDIPGFGKPGQNGGNGNAGGTLKTFKNQAPLVLQQQ